MATHKYFLIVNLIAGQGRCKAIFPKVRDELEKRDIEFDLHYTNEPLEATDVCRMGLDAGFTHVVAMGGDGTVNEVANGLVGRDGVLCVIPAGTGNDFIRVMGIPDDPFDALAVLTTGEERVIDLAQVDGDRCLVNGLGIGIDAQVAQAVLKQERFRGKAAYVYAAVREALRFPAFPVTLTIEGWKLDLDCISVGVANGQFCGGGFRLAPRADVEDAMLDVSAIGDFPRLERIVRLPQARAGKHLDLPQVHYRQAEAVHVASPAKLVAHIDGEPFRLPSEGFTVRVLPRALRVLTPAKTGGSSAGA